MPDLNRNVNIALLQGRGIDPITLERHWRKAKKFTKVEYGGTNYLAAWAAVLRMLGFKIPQVYAEHDWFTIGPVSAQISSCDHNFVTCTVDGVVTQFAVIDIYLGGATLSSAVVG